MRVKIIQNLSEKKSNSNFTDCIGYCVFEVGDGMILTLFVNKTQEILLNRDNICTT